jgi:hypothetical protein
MHLRHSAVLMTIINQSRELGFTDPIFAPARSATPTWSTP